MPRWYYPFLLAGVVAIIARFIGLPPLVVFVLSCLGLIPLAGLIGQATEHLAHHVGPRLGGLLNASLGNAAEMIIALVALREGLLDLVKASITGSIIGNALLVLGTGLLLGGLRHGQQRYDGREAGRNAALMLVAVVGLVLPAIFVNFSTDAFVLEEVSIAVAAILLLLYAAYLVFILSPSGAAEVGMEAHVADSGAAVWPVGRAAATLVGATVGTVVMSELLVSTVEPVTHALGLSAFFVGIIIVPLVGNVAEHFSAIIFAARNKVDIALAIAAGSSTQIALFVAPLTVFASLLFGHPMSLAFHPAEVVAVAAAVGIFAYVSVDGESNWLEGLLLVGLYLLLALFFLFLPVEGVAAPAH